MWSALNLRECTLKFLRNGVSSRGSVQRLNCGRSNLWFGHHILVAPNFSRAIGAARPAHNHEAHIMPFKVQVGPPQIAIHQGQTVLVSEPDGQINWPSDKGLYFLDTRIVSSWAIYANGEPWSC